MALSRPQRYDVNLTMKILVLGGTIAARTISDRLADQSHEVIYSLAGASSQPKVPAVSLRSGGFCGAEGLAAYIRTQSISLLVDVTHPFAAQISRNAALAAAACGIALLRYERAPWEPFAGDNWIICENVNEAATFLSAGATVFLAIGRQHVAPFLARQDISGTMRMIEPPEVAPTQKWQLLLARPPFKLEDEINLLQRGAFTHLVCKNSGGAEGLAKLEAARALHIPVVIISRPHTSGGIIVRDINQFDDLERLLGVNNSLTRHKPA
jgi:precorrin-6A/cobalt-precorrin-6A reductase